DQRIHGHQEQRAKADLRTHPTVEKIKQTIGKYSEIELVKRDTTRDADDRGAPHRIRLNSHQWDETVRKLAVIFGIAKNSTMQTGGLASVARLADDTSASIAITQINTGVLSPLREEETHYYAMAVLGKTNDSLKLATVTWDKEPLESWIVRAENELRNALTVPTPSFALPNIAAAGCL